MVLGKKILIYDLDDTLYNKTQEFADLLDSVMATALIEDLAQLLEDGMSLLDFYEEVM